MNTPQKKMQDLLDSVVAQGRSVACNLRFTTRAGW